MSILIIFIFGLAIGSFLNVCIDRLSNEQSLNGRSHCDFCKKKLGPIDLVPVLSYFFLGGKCRYCHKKLSFFYPFVEMLTGVVFVLLSFWLVQNRFWSPFGPQNDVGMIMELIVYCGITSSLIVIFFADYKYHIIPDEATIALIIFSIFPVISNPHIQSGMRDLNPILSNFLTHIVAGILLFAILSIIYHGSLFFLKKEGMGYGDVKLAFAMGFLLGPKAGGVGLYLSFLIGGVVGSLLLLTGKKGRKSMIAFGPFMVAGIVIMLFFNEYILGLLQPFIPYLK